MTASRFQFLLRVILAACASWLAVLILFSVAVNTALAEFVNPHGELGWIGLTLVFVVSLLSASALLLSLPPVLLTLLRTPAARSRGRIAVAALASMVLVAGAAIVVSSLVSALGAA